MKKILLSVACAFIAPFAFAQTATTTTTTTYTDGTGTITEYVPGETFILKESAGPRPYKVTKTTTYVTKSGKVLTAEDVKTRIRVGLPISIKFMKHDNDMVVDRVVVDD